MKNILILLFALITFNAGAQKIDNVIPSPTSKGAQPGVYTSYFSNQLKVPVFVTYTIYHAGGNCSRAAYRFTNDTKFIMADPGDYSHSGYDEGHLADAADFSSVCPNEESTFRFYNALPQTPNLNRGCWKQIETQLRKQSQTDSLYIVCGGIFDNLNLTIGKHQVAVPTRCWKISENLRIHKVEHVWIFDNLATATIKEITLQQLQTELATSQAKQHLVGFTIPLKK